MVADAIMIGDMHCTQVSATWRTATQSNCDQIVKASAQD